MYTSMENYGCGNSPYNPQHIPSMENPGSGNSPLKLCSYTQFSIALSSMGCGGNGVMQSRKEVIGLQVCYMTYIIQIKTAENDTCHKLFMSYMCAISGMETTITVLNAVAVTSSMDRITLIATGLGGQVGATLWA